MSEQTSTRPAKPIDVIRQQFNSPAWRDQLKLALPPHVSVDKFVRVTLSLLQNNSDLLQCDRQSLFSAVITVAQLGLMPDPILGEAYIGEFKGKATVIVGYRGLMKLARQSGEVRSIYAELIHQNDEFTYQAGTDRKLLHKPCWGTDPGAIIGAYAVAELNDGFVQFEIMPISAIETIRKALASPKSKAWNGIGYGEMCRKTVLRRLLKYLPMTVDPAAISDGEDPDGVAAGLPAPRPMIGPASEPVQLPPRRRSRLSQLADQADTGVDPVQQEQPAANDEPPYFGDDQQAQDTVTDV